MYTDHITRVISFFHFSAFVMDEFKRKYSNEDTLTVAIPHFWEHFDREGYSIWHSQYKYPEELTLTFKSCNLITGETQQQPFYKTPLVSLVSKVTLLLWLFIGWKANAEKALFSSLVLHLSLLLHVLAWISSICLGLLLWPRNKLGSEAVVCIWEFFWKSVDF